LNEEREITKKERILKPLFNAALLVIFLLLSLPFIFRVASICSDLAGFDYSLKLTFGKSMFPTIRNGDTVLLQKGAENIKVGDVISFKINSTTVPILHRVVEIKENQSLIFKTKGDGNLLRDYLNITTSQIIGKVVMIIPTSYYMTPFFLLPIVFLFVILLSKKLLDYHNQKSATVLPFKHLIRNPTAALLLMNTTLSIGNLISLILLTNL